jgi:hypothetical protein
MGKLSTVNADGTSIDVNRQLIDLGFAERFGD